MWTVASIDQGGEFSTGFSTAPFLISFFSLPLRGNICIYICNIKNTHFRRKEKTPIKGGVLPHLRHLSTTYKKVQI